MELARTDIACNAICPDKLLTAAIVGRLRRKMQRDGAALSVVGSR